ncbi:MAG: L-lactate dehydrogenase [Desulfomonilaceae bacterium]|nr:L-lactate dehydrogenase [Desulfomonilaceae bacterium]
MKIGIVGSGLVGSTSAYAMVMQGIGREIVLVDKNMRRAAAEAMDITHAVPFAYPLKVRSGDYRDLAGSVAVVIAAGVSQKPGESRLELLERNARVFKEIVPSILNNAADAVLVVATNPVDIMTHLTATFAAEFDVSPRKVIGTGTTLDTARFRSLLGSYLGVDPHHVHGYVLGEHGDSEVLTWSIASVGAMSLEVFCRLRGIVLDHNVRGRVDDQVRNAAYSIIEGKGATYYAIGSAVAKIVDVILHDQRSVLTVTTPALQVAGIADVSVSLPRIIGGQGVLADLPLDLSQTEQSALSKSSMVVRSALDELYETT